MSGTKPLNLILLVLVIAVILQLQLPFTSGNRGRAPSLFQPPPNPTSNKLSGLGPTAAWSYEDKATPAREEKFYTSYAAVVGSGDQQQPPGPTTSKNDNINASASIKILQIGGPIVLLIVVVILIYFLFIQKRNDFSFSMKGDTKCDCATSCFGFNS